MYTLKKINKTQRSTPRTLFHPPPPSDIVSFLVVLVVVVIVISRRRPCRPCCRYRPRQRIDQTAFFSPRETSLPRYHRTALVQPSPSQLSCNIHFEDRNAGGRRKDCLFKPKKKKN